MQDIFGIKIDTSKMNLEELKSTQAKVRNLLFEARCTSSNVGITPCFYDFFDVEINLYNMNKDELNELINKLRSLLFELNSNIASKSRRQ